MYISLFQQQRRKLTNLRTMYLQIARFHCDPWISMILNLIRPATQQSPTITIISGTE
jgi:hypothetical protein